MADKHPRIYLLRHGETEWTISGQHTGMTDVALTEKGRSEAKCIAKAIQGISFAKVFSSPRQRAQETAKLAGFTQFEIEPNLSEWNYGKYEGMKTADIVKESPGWNVFDSGCPEGETAEDVGKRADIVIAKIRKVNGDVALFSHAHFLRVFAARWLNLNPICGKLFYLNTASLSILGYEHNEKESIVRLWNSTAHL